jgi:hypothetical protein
VSQWIAVVLVLVLFIGFGGYVLGWVRHSNYSDAYRTERENSYYAPEPAGYVLQSALVPTVVTVYVVVPRLSPVYFPSVRELPCGEWVGASELLSPWGD